MLDATLKAIAFATMDGAIAFDLHLAPTAPDGDQVVELAHGDRPEDVLQAARFVTRMAKTFFPDKLGARQSHVVEGETVRLYLVARLPELDGFFVEELDERQDPQAG